MTFANNLRRLRRDAHLTQDELAIMIGTSKQAISRYERSNREPNIKTARLIAEALNVPLAELIPHADDLPPSDTPPAGLSPLPRSRAFPLLGDIACGSPILAEENISEYLRFPEDLKADFCLRCRGDSMIDARIHDGDIVFIHQQAEVDNGDIAAVLIGDETTLKRVYRTGNTLTLMAANAAYAPMVYTDAQLAAVRILGKAVSFLSCVK